MEPARIEKSEVRWNRMTIFPSGKVQQTRLHRRWMGRHAAFRRVARSGRQQLSDDAWVSCTPNKQINIARLAGRSRNSVWSHRWWHRIRPPRAISREMSCRRRRKRLHGVAWERGGRRREKRSRVALVRVPVYFGECAASQKDHATVYPSAFTTPRH